MTKPNKKIGIHEENCPHCLNGECECECRTCRPDLWKKTKPNKKITRIYGVGEMYIAFVDAEGFSGTMSFVRGKRSADVKVKIVYSKLENKDEYKLPEHVEWKKYYKKLKL